MANFLKLFLLRGIKDKVRQKRKRIGQLKIILKILKINSVRRNYFTRTNKYIDYNYK